MTSVFENNVYITQQTPLTEIFGHVTWQKIGSNYEYARRLVN